MKKLIVVLLCVSGCASINNTMQSWVGHSQTELLVSWGPPQQVMQDGAATVYVYTQTRTYTSPGTSTTFGSVSPYGTLNATTVYNPSYTSSYNAYRMFWIDETGRMFNWFWKGL